MDRSPRPRVVIVGAGFGGLTAARALAGAPVAVTVVDRRNHHVFQPLLYQVATAALSPGDIAYPIRSILRPAEEHRGSAGRGDRDRPGRARAAVHGRNDPLRLPDCRRRGGSLLFRPRRL